MTIPNRYTETPPTINKRGFLNIATMKRIFGILFVSALIMSGCGSSKKQLEVGNYDAAISKAVSELRNGL
jgi:VIT1/CCC1 family predicted Fe2+/Mn2+ transporter